MSDLPTRDVVSGEARFILQHLATNAREGRSNHMADIRAELENAVTLDFADYLKFLKKFKYITLNRQEHTLGLTEEGDRVVEGYDIDRFVHEVGDYFRGRVQEEAKVVVREDTQAHAPPYAERSEHTRVGQVGGGDLRYVKYDEIGSGGLGTVYLGRHNTLGTDLAIKEIKDLFGHFSFLDRASVVDRLTEAVKAQAHLDHPSVLRIVDLEGTVAHPYWVMELAKGGSLRRLMEKRGGEPLPERVALRYLLQILHALKSAHQENVIHGNLKPENVLLDACGNVKLGDFGLSSVLEVETEGKNLPQVFLSTGAMDYMAPEQIQKKKEEIDASTDVYAVGILLYEMLTGEPPGRRAPLPSEVNRGVSKSVDRLFDKMTQDRKSKRYPDVDAVLADFYKAFPDGKYGQEGDLLLFMAPPDLGEAKATAPKEAGPAAKKEEASAASKTGSKEAAKAESKKDGDAGTASGAAKASRKTAGKTGSATS